MVKTKKNNQVEKQLPMEESNMIWEDIIKQKIEKENSPILENMGEKERKALKKTLQSVEPTEYFGRDFTQMGELIDMLAQLDLVKADTKLKKKMLTLDERNIDMVATASKLRKEYEVLYREIRDTIYPNKKGELRDD